MRLETANLFFRAAKNWVARHVRISGLGTNPTNPWCQHPRRPPLQYTTAATPRRTTNLSLGRKELRMTRVRLAWETVKLLSGGAALFAGLSLLTTAPLTSVLVTLGAMGFMLIPAARLCGAEMRH